MSLKLLTRSTATVGSLALAAGLLIGTAHAVNDPANAGRALAWGVAGTPDPTLAADLLTTPLSKVASGGSQAVFLTAAGNVYAHVSAEEDAAPSSLNTQHIVDVATNGAAFVALSDQSELTFWGVVGNLPNLGDADVDDLTQVSLGGGHGVGVKTDGTVVAWGDNTHGQIDVPDGLTDVVKVVTGYEVTYALRSDGSLEAWGRDQFNQVSHVPAELKLPGAVKDIAARSGGGLALLTDGTLASWGDKATSGRGAKLNLVPDSLTGKTIVKISASSDSNLAVDSEGEITVWGSGTLPTNVPADLDGRTLSSVSVGSNYAFAIQRAVMTISESVVTGTAKEGQTLTGTPASFSGGPEITYEWLADDDQIDGATGTTLELTKAEVGKRITFRTVATQDGDVLTSDSPKTAVVAANVAATKTKVNKVKVKHTKKGKKNGKATIKVKVTGKNKPTGKVKFVVKKGKKKVFTKTKKLNKKAVAKVKVKKLKKGKYKVVATYKGNATNKKSKANKKFRVK